MTTGLFHNYTEYVSNQKYILRFSIWYLALNMIVVPLLSVSTNSTPFQLLDQLFQWKPFSREFIFEQSCK